MGSKILTYFFSEKNRVNTLRKTIAPLKRDGKPFKEETDQLLPIKEKMDALWIDVEFIRQNTDIKLMAFEYQTAIVEKRNSPIQINARTVLTLAQSNPASEVAPPGVPGDNQTLSSGKRRLEDTSLSQNSDLLNEENFQIVTSEKSKKQIVSDNMDSVSDMKVSVTNTKVKKTKVPQSKSYRLIHRLCF